MSPKILLSSVSCLASDSFQIQIMTKYVRITATVKGYHGLSTLNRPELIMWVRSVANNLYVDKYVLNFTPGLYCTETINKRSYLLRNNFPTPNKLLDSMSVNQSRINSNFRLYTLIQMETRIMIQIGWDGRQKRLRLVFLWQICPCFQGMLSTIMRATTISLLSSNKYYMWQNISNHKWI